MTRYTNGPAPIGPAATALATHLAAEHAPDGRESLIGATWWAGDRDSREWRIVRRWFLAPHTCFKADDVVLRMPFEFDQMLREWMVCATCKAGGPTPAGMASGHDDCPLGPTPWAGNPMHPGGTLNHFLAVKRLDGDRWHLVKRRCPGRQLRAQEIAALDGRMRDIGGGMRGVEV
jgi:hypothetical protein